MKIWTEMNSWQPHWDETVKYTAHDGWRGNRIKERMVLNAIRRKLPENMDLNTVMEVIKNQNEY